MRPVRAINSIKIDSTRDDTSNAMLSVIPDSPRAQP